jgi:hypothetical protein
MPSHGRKSYTEAVNHRGKQGPREFETNHPVRSKKELLFAIVMEFALPHNSRLSSFLAETRACTQL